MKRQLAALLAVALVATPLGACSVWDKYFCSTCSLSTAAPSAMNAAKKALTAAHTLHQAAAEGMTAAAQSGLLHGSNAVTAQNYLDQSETYLGAADNLVAAGDATGIEAKVASATALISQVEALTGGK